MRHAFAGLALAGAMGAAGSAMAAADDSGYHAIAHGNLAAAEAQIASERRLFRQDPDLLLNLAYVYARTGRVEQARALYGDVLARPAEDVDLANGDSIDSHVAARAGLLRIAGIQFSAR